VLGKALQQQYRLPAPGLGYVHPQPWQINLNQ
jgi:hypothetical protein